MNNQKLLMDLLNDYEKRKNTVSNGTSKKIETVYNIDTLKNILFKSKDLPKLKMMFGSFLFERELSFIGATSNIGKTLLSVQLANNISRGVKTLGLTNQSEPQKVLFYDFELNERNLSIRYENYNQFSDNFFYRLGYDIENFGIDTIETDIMKTGATVIFIDNLTALTDNLDLTKGNDAIKLMKDLLKLKNKLGITIIVVSHTVKTPENMQLSINSLQGSKNLVNLSDSVTMISEADNRKYIKSMKCRNGLKYSDVLEIELKRNNDGNLEFFPLGWLPEKSILSNNNTAIDENLLIVKELFKTQSQRRYSDIKQDLMTNYEMKETKARYFIGNLIKNNMLIKDNNVYMINQNTVKFDSIEEKPENNEYEW